MRKFYAGLSVAAFVVALAAPAFAKEETVKGQIVDQSCYMKDKASNAGRDHKMPQDVTDCAVSCAKKGAPLALLTSDGKLYTIGGELAANKNEKLIAHVAHTVEITGDVTEKDGKTMIAADSLKMVSR
ncbi:MAG TPA: hypothetical protein VGJ29_21270 [Vicinamibacterales bacterium]|jgi:hypothetical protein